MASMGFGYNPKPTPPTPQPVNPYDTLPDAQPYDNTWYQNELNRLNRLAQQSAQQQRNYASQNAQQYSDFAAQYTQQRNAMIPEQRPRQSRAYYLGGY